MNVVKVISGEKHLAAIKLVKPLEPEMMIIKDSMDEADEEQFALPWGKCEEEEKENASPERNAVPTLVSLCVRSLLQNIVRRSLKKQ